MVLPDTFTFIDDDYNGTRFTEKSAIVFGGSSGIGFATSAMLIQECVDDLMIVARNFVQLEAAAQVLRTVQQTHCQNMANVVTMVADVRHRDQVVAVFEKAKTEFGGVDLVLNTAGIAGYVGVGVDSIPNDIFMSKFDAVVNNLYGAIYITAEALKSWNIDSSESHGESDPVPVIVNLASEEALAPCPGCDLYGISKSGIVGLSRAIAAMYEGKVRTHVVAPGLVDTPLSWNQVRGSYINKTTWELVQADPLQTYQCYSKDGHKTIIEDGTCSWGGTGMGCPCEDVKRSDPRLPLKYGPHLWPPIDPRQVGHLVLYLASNDGSHLSGTTFVMDNNFTMNSTHHQVRDCPASMIELCPIVELNAQGQFTQVISPNQKTPALGFDHLLCVLFGILVCAIFNKLTNRIETKRHNSERESESESKSTPLLSTL